MSEYGSADNPIHVREVADGPDSYARALMLITKTVSAAYTLMVTWEMLKMLFPHLKLKEDIARAWLRAKLESKPHEVYVPHAWVREVYDDLRGGGDAD